MAFQRTTSKSSVEATAPKFRLISSFRTAILESIKRDVFLVLLPSVALVLGVFWAAIIPLWQTPDEPAHFAYIQSLSEENALFPDREFSRELTETYELSGLVRVPFDPAARQPFLARSTWGPAERQIVSLPATLRRESVLGSRNPAVSYPPGYYFLASLPYRALASGDILSIMFGLRVFSALLTSFTILFSYLTLRLYFGDRAVARTAAFLIALSPMYIYMGMAVNVEVLVCLLFSVQVFFLTRALKQGLTMRMNLALSALVGGGLWVKQTFLVGIIFYLLLLAFIGFRRSITWATVLRYALVFFGVILLMDGWLYLSGVIATSPGLPAPALSLGGFLRHFGEYWSSYRWALQETFWGSFGWLDTPLSKTLYGAVGFISLAALVGFVAYLLVATLRRQPRVAALFFSLVIVIFGGALSVLNYNVIQSGAGWFLQGRYLFPIMAPILAILVTGLTWFAPRRLKQTILFGSIGGMILFHTVVLFNYVIPRYYL
jgi:4-amino-4-deoxy-L-arabinose transferase-like glycosyltransferase